MAWYDVFNLKKGMEDDINDLLKVDAMSVGDKLPETPIKQDKADGDIGRKAILHDPYWQQMSQHVLFKHKTSRLSNRTLKDMSLRDWLVSTIIQIRVDTILRFARPQQSKFEMGYRIVPKDQDARLTEQEKSECYALEQLLYHCGRVEGTPEDDKMLFGKFLKMIVRDALTFGYVAVEKILTRGGALHRFRPLPAEGVYLIDERASKEFLKKELQNAKNIFQNPRSDNDPKKEHVINEADLEYFKYIQVGGDNRTLAIFGDEDMIFKNFNPQNFADLMGYCYSPVEMAVINITNHLNVENYNANFFTHGYAARGVLHLKGTVTQSQLIAFRRQFYNTINGTQNAWRTPIISGLDDIDWIPLSGSNREMEYINFNSHIMRSVCSQFQIDPMELGLDYLVSATGRAPAGSESNKEKISYSRERGLYPILMFIEDLVNESILPLIDPKLAEKYCFKFEGYTDETPQTEVALLQAEMTVHRSMNDLLRAARKPEMKHPIADLPLNPQFWQLVEKNMTKGEIREQFFGDEGATEKRELQYIPGDPMFTSWQQMLMALDGQKMQMGMQQQQMMAMQEQEQKKQQQEDAKHQREEEKHQMNKEKHEMEVGTIKDASARSAVMRKSSDED